MAVHAESRISADARSQGWVRVFDKHSEYTLSRGPARITLGFSASGAAVRCAGYYPVGMDHWVVSDRRPLRHAPRRGALDVVLGWLSGDPDPVNPCGSTAVLIPCAQRKLAHSAPAAELYDSAHFRFSLRAARSQAARAVGARADVYVLSAMHGLVRLGKVLDPYDLTIGDPDAITAKKLADQLGMLGITQVEALLPARYLGLLYDAAAVLRGQRTVFAVKDLYRGAPGIGHQRAVLAELLRCTR